MPADRPVHIVRGPCSGCAETVVATHRGPDGLCRHRTPSGRLCGPVSPMAYVRGGCYPELLSPHPPTIPLDRNTYVHVVRPIGERLVLVRVPGMERTRGPGMDCCLVPRAELSSERWADVSAFGEPEVERHRRRIG